MGLTMRNIQPAFVAILALLTLHDAPSAAQARTIYDLGGIVGRANLAMDVNNRGDVVGVGAFQSEVLAETRALLWSRGTLVTLPPLPGDIASMAESSQTLAVRAAKREICRTITF